ncbi:hypothetical protein N7508_005443 [Penicillium antarcticum]|uniref:uncharacterized protein n=1 Tax=Penicillium antarcticum TaxID=416450 RepID=UPI002392EA4A|nr:uncharacterized protein N7508_005443 [Penicillium antarcticum]KAJ5306428.1 hypothetical protein N7508_005443 [Penicillium antarcticum]
MQVTAHANPQIPVAISGPELPDPCHEVVTSAISHQLRGIACKEHALKRLGESRKGVTNV